MNILFVIPIMGCGGAEVLLSNMAIELAQRGMKVKLVCLHPHYYTYKDLRTREKLEELVEIKILEKSTGFSLRSRTSGKTAELQSIINDFRPDVIHSHLFEAEIESRACHYPKAIWVTHCHDNMPQLRKFSLSTLLNKRRAIEYLEKVFLFKKYKELDNYFIAISKNTESYFEDVLPAKLIKNIRLIHNGIDLSYFSAANHQRDSNPIHLVNTGTFVAKKNQAFLVDVIKKLLERGVNAKLTMLGVGELRSVVHDKVNEYGLNDMISLPGNVSTLADYFFDANMYVHSALYEPFGLVLIEAMAAGLPVISLDGGGNKDIIKDGENGYMIKDPDIDLFCDAIIALSQDQYKYDQISQSAASFSRNFDIKVYASRLLDLYRVSSKHKSDL